MFLTDVSLDVAPDYKIYQKRREVLVQEVRKDNRDPKRGLVLLFENFELENKALEGDSNFAYFSGIKNESSCVVAIEFSEGSCKYSLYVPNLMEHRKKYLGHFIEPSEKMAKIMGFDEICFLGDADKDSGQDFLCKYFERSDYLNLLNLIDSVVKSDGKIYTINPDDKYICYDQRFVIDRIKGFLPNLTKESIVDIAAIAARMRKKKDKLEIEAISKALELTALVHEKIAKFICSKWHKEKKDETELVNNKSDKSVISTSIGTDSSEIVDKITEKQIQAKGEMIIVSHGGELAYPSLVAGDRDAEILHNFENKNSVRDFVVVDMAAKLDGYTSDITRTYPVSGFFTKKQKELYSLLLATQKYIISIAKPGFYLINRTDKTKSLSALAREFLDKNGEKFLDKNLDKKEDLDKKDSLVKKEGFGKYMTHSIGHHMGRDVHDFGDLYFDPLEEGSVVTVEPGIYGVPYFEEDGSKKFFSVRIEDDILITKDGAKCLSSMIPKELDELKDFMLHGLKKDLRDSIEKDLKK